jgi:hypothetical protein
MNVVNRLNLYSNLIFFFRGSINEKSKKYWVKVEAVRRQWGSACPQPVTVSRPE